MYLETILILTKQEKIGSLNFSLIDFFHSTLRGFRSIIKEIDPNSGYPIALVDNIMGMKKFRLKININ